MRTSFNLHYQGMFETQKSGNKTRLGEIGLNTRPHASSKMGQDQVYGGVSVLCLHATPVANVLRQPHGIGWKAIVQFGNKVTNWCNVRSMEGVTAYGHPLECLVTFGRGGLNIAWQNTRNDHRTFWETISNASCHFPVLAACWKV